MCRSEPVMKSGAQRMRKLLVHTLSGYDKQEVNAVTMPWPNHSILNMRPAQSVLASLGGWVPTHPQRIGITFGRVLRWSAALSHWLVQSIA